MHHAREDEQLLLVTEGGILIRMNVSEIRRIGRATQGVRLIRLDEGDRVVSVAVTDGENDNDDNGEDTGIAEDQVGDGEITATAENSTEDTAAETGEES